MQITTLEAYQEALEQIAELRKSGKTATSSPELAELQSAIEAYETKPQEPDESKGKPTPSPYRET